MRRGGGGRETGWGTTPICLRLHLTNEIYQNNIMYAVETVVKASTHPKHSRLSTALLNCQEGAQLPHSVVQISCHSVSVEAIHGPLN